MEGKRKREEIKWEPSGGQKAKKSRNEQEASREREHKHKHKEKCALGLCLSARSLQQRRTWSLCRQAYAQLKYSKASPCCLL